MRGARWTLKTTCEARQCEVAWRLCILIVLLLLVDLADRVVHGVLVRGQRHIRHVIVVVVVGVRVWLQQSCQFGARVMVRTLGGGCCQGCRSCGEEQRVLVHGGSG